VRGLPIGTQDLDGIETPEVASPAAARLGFSIGVLEADERASAPARGLAAPAREPAPTLDAEREEKLRALGYVE
jgi:hypothetical protein